MSRGTTYAGDRWPIYQRAKAPTLIEPNTRVVHRIAGWGRVVKLKPGFARVEWDAPSNVRVGGTILRRAWVKVADLRVEHDPS